MNALRSFACCSAAVFLLSACSSFPPNGIDDDLPTEEESDAAAILGNRDDVAVRLVEILPIEAGGSSRFTAEVLGILGSYGDGGVVRPELNVVADPSVTFTTVPEGCTVVPAVSIALLTHFSLTRAAWLQRLIRCRSNLSTRSLTALSCLWCLN